MAHPLAVALLNLLAPGLGYVYLGRAALALIYLLANFLFLGIAGWTGAMFRPGTYYTMLAAGVVIALIPFAHCAWLANTQANRFRRWYNRLWAYLGWVVLSWLAVDVVIGHRADWFGYESFRIAANSMAPTFERGDWVVTDAWAWRDAEPEYGALVIYEADGVRVSRLVGKPGDRLEIRDDVLIRNGVPVDENYLYAGFDRGGPNGDFGAVKVPDDSWFMLGDNRQRALDSRRLGPIPTSKLSGRVMMRVFAADGRVRWERFPTVFERLPSRP